MSTATYQILALLAQFDWCTRNKVMALPPSGGTLRNTLAKLRQGGEIEVVIRITEAGREKLSRMSQAETRRKNERRQACATTPLDRLPTERERSMPTPTDKQLDEVRKQAVAARNFMSEG